jgi:hypothetical protein
MSDQMEALRRVKNQLENHGLDEVEIPDKKAKNQA